VLQLRLLALHAHMHDCDIMRFVECNCAHEDEAGAGGQNGGKVLRSSGGPGGAGGLPPGAAASGCEGVRTHSTQCGKLVLNMHLQFYTGALIIQRGLQFFLCAPVDNHTTPSVLTSPLSSPIKRRHHCSLLCLTVCCVFGPLWIITPPQQCLHTCSTLSSPTACTCTLVAPSVRTYIVHTSPPLCSPSSATYITTPPLQCRNSVHVCTITLPPIHHINTMYMAEHAFDVYVFAISVHVHS
jgi:hypothetical protein